MIRKQEGATTGGTEHTRWLQLRVPHTRHEPRTHGGKVTRAQVEWGTQRGGSGCLPTAHEKPCSNETKKPFDPTKMGKRANLTTNRQQLGWFFWYNMYSQKIVYFLLINILRQKNDTGFSRESAEKSHTRPRATGFLISFSSYRLVVLVT